MTRTRPLQIPLCGVRRSGETETSDNIRQSESSMGGSQPIGGQEVIIHSFPDEDEI